MMGEVRVGGFKITVSGGAGDDGLPHDCDHKTPSFEDLLPYLTEIPWDLASIFWTDNGHNTVGHQAQAALAKWTHEHLKELTKRKKVHV